MNKLINDYVLVDTKGHLIYEQISEIQLLFLAQVV